ncbi:DsbA family protein [Couchioplanes caeruleus]|uniref:DsbA family oxidoreductase n=1 Tax=Couchioplanes caeruleus TaxID=56438 RepID=UPI0020BFD11C|nr:DsbA family protein [Couchioplanes caeruleus]UQU61526.1 DsbA family protein [Couchioplanes caeruleus]
MRVTVYGDFNCPYSYLASLRIDALLRQGVEVGWRAVEHSPRLSMTGSPAKADPGLGGRALAQVRLLAAPDERTPRSAPALISNTYAATSAYAEAVTDGLHHEVRRALFDAIWIGGRHLGNPYDVRDVVSDISYPPFPIEPYRCSPDRALPRYGDGSPLGMTRALGATTSFSGAPITTTGWLRMRRWHDDWLATAGGGPLPVLVEEQGATLTGIRALAFLAELRTGPAAQRTPVTAEALAAA